MNSRALVLGCWWGLLSTGCVLGIPQSAEVDGTGQSSGSETRTVSCGSVATLERYEAGSGPMGIEITDGTGKTVFENGDGVTGEINDSQQIAGAAGTWTFVVDPDGFAGQFKITLQCL